MPSLDRRRFVQLATGGIASAALGCRASPSDPDASYAEALAAGALLPRPSPAQLAWQRAELGVVFHYDLHVFDGRRYVQGRNRRTPIEDPDLFAPAEYDPDQWLAAAADLGARFAILTACHETGFRLWPSAHNEFSTRALAWGDGRADVVGDFVAACRRRGIAPGIYYGARWNARLGVLDFRVTEGSALTQADYNALVEKEVEELCTGYGPLFELWFDGGILAPDAGGPDVLPIVERHQPDCLFYHSDQRRDARWGGSESGTVPYPCWATVELEGIRTEGAGDGKLTMLKHGTPTGRDWCPAMSDAPLRGANGRHEWFWEPDDDGAVFPLEHLVAMYEGSVGRNSTLIVGLTPDPRGRLPEVDARRCREWGEAIRGRFGVTHETAGIGERLLLELPAPRPVERVQIREAIEHGERVRSYRVRLRTAAGWVDAGGGSCIGQCRIHPLPAAGAVVADAIELTVDDAVATPIVTRLGV